MQEQTRARRIRIGEREIGEGCPAYIIAEMSANHAGSLQRAKEIIRAAKESGADCIKIQTYTPDTLTIDCDNPCFQVQKGTWEGENLYGLYGKAYTPWEWQGQLKEEAEKAGIDFLSTPFDRTSVDFLEELGLGFYKIASFEMVDLPLLKYIASKGKPIIMSTGMATLEEIREAVDTIFSAGNRQLAIMRCSSVYPADPADMHLSTIADMMRRFPNLPVGLSDHSLGHLSAVTAVALGASVIEKHFCISREIENPDASFSMTPAEFRSMVQEIRRVEAALGTPYYGPGEKEKESIVFRRSVFAVKDMEEGEPFTEENIRIIRPGYGLMPREYEGLLGKTCTRAVKRGEPVTADLVKNYVELIPAAEEHKELLFAWVNDPLTRRQSFCEDPVSWEEHCAWYQKILESSDRKLYVCLHNGTAVGTLRLELSGDEARISYSIASAFRRRGYGAELLKAAERLAAKAFPETKILTAEVKPENAVSASLFRRLGYEERAQEKAILFRKRIGNAV